MQFRGSEEVLCYCCDLPVKETFEHIFISCPILSILWSYFTFDTGI